MSQSAVAINRESSLGGLMAWLVCLSAGLFFFYEFFQLNIFNVINEQLRHDFSVDAESISLMSSAYLWADLLFLIPAGLILDRLSVRQVIISAMLLCILGTIGFAITTSFALASFFHFLSGVGNAFCFLSCVVLISNWFPPKRQALVIGTVVTMAFLGGLMAQTPFHILVNHYGWRQTLAFDAAFGLLLLIWIVFIVKNHPKDSSATFQKSTASGGQMLSDLKHAMSNRQNWLAGVYTWSLNLPIMILCALWGHAYLKTAFHLNGAEAATVSGLIYIGSMIGCPIVGWLSDFMGKRKVVMSLGAWLTLACFGVLFAVSSLGYYQLAVLFFLIGFFSSSQVVSYPLIAESNEANQVGASTSVASVLIMGGAGVAQVVFGWLLVAHGGHLPFGSEYSAADYHYAMMLFPVTLIMAIVALYFIRETNCQR